MAVNKIFEDTFTVASDTVLPSHTPDIGSSWTNIHQTGGETINAVAASDTALPVSQALSRGAGYSADATYAIANYHVEFKTVDTPPSGSDDFLWAFIRWQDTNTAYLLYITTSTAGDPALLRRTGGTNTQLDFWDNSSSAGGIPWAANDIYCIEAIGSEIVAYANEVSFLYANDANITAAGKGGFGFGDYPGYGGGGDTAAAGQEIDDFRVYQIDVDKTNWQSPTTTGEVNNNFTNPANAYASDNSMADSGLTIGNKQDYGDFSLNVPSGATIIGIQVKIEGNQPDANWITGGVRLSWDNGTTWTAQKSLAHNFWGSADKFVVFGHARSLWGRTWTQSELSNANFRIQLELLAQYTGTREWLVDHIQVRVFYSLPATLIQKTLDYKVRRAASALQKTLKYEMVTPVIPIHIDLVQASWSSTSTSFSNIYGYYLHESANFDGSLKAYFQATINTSNASYACSVRLYDVTTAAAVPNTTLSTTSTTWVDLQTTTDIADQLIDGHVYMVQIMTANAVATARCMGARIVLRHKTLKQPSAITNFQPIGVASSVTGAGSDSYTTPPLMPKVLYDGAQYDGTLNVYFEATLYTSGSTASDITYARLWDVTSGAAVSGSEVSIAGNNGNTQRVRSGAITLTNGNEYVVQIKQAVTGDTAYVYSAHLVYKQTGSIKKTQLHQLVNSIEGSTTSTTFAYFYAGMLFNKAMFINYVSVNAYFESNIKTNNASGITTANLYDLTNTTTLSGDITTSSLSYVRQRTASFDILTPTSNLDDLKQQLKTNNASYTAYILASRIIYNVQLISAVAYSIQKSLKYTVKSPVAITKSLKYTAKTTPAATTKGLIYRIRQVLSLTKSLWYTVKRTATAVTKSLKYTVWITPSALTKQLAYAVRITPSALTKSLQYAIKRAVSVTKSLQYTVKTTPSAITKQLIYAVKSTPSALTKALQYTIKSPVSLTKQLIYAVKTTPSALTKSLRYAVRKSTAITKTLQYEILTAVPKLIQKSLKYSIKTVTSITKQLKYTVKTIPSALTKSLKYTTKTTPTAINKSLQYFVRKVIAITKSLQYAIKTTPSAMTKSLSYYVRRATAITKSLQYTIKSGVAITKSLQYIIKRSVALTKSLQYAVKITPAALTKSLQYAIKRGVAIAKSLQYTVKTTPSVLTKSLRYAIFLGAFSITKSLRYSVKTISAITKQLKYTVKTSTATTKTLIYRVVGQGGIITKSLRYAIRNPYSVTKSLVYAIKSTPSALTKGLQYTVKRVSAITKQLKYTVLTIPSALTKQLWYAVRKTPTASTKQLHYAIVRPVSITKSLTYGIRITQIVVITKELKYTVKAPAPHLSKLLTYHLLIGGYVDIYVPQNTLYDEKYNPQSTGYSEKYTAQGTGYNEKYNPQSTGYNELYVPQGTNYTEKYN